MLQKRIIGVIAVENGMAVQSIKYQRTLPLGRPEMLAENLDRWGADEIMILDLGRSRKGLGPDMDLIHRLGALGLTTPLSYGGGVITAEHAVAVIQAGVERVCIDSLLHDNPERVISLTQLVGAQAIIAAFPVNIHEYCLQWYDHRKCTVGSLSSSALALLDDGYISEALVVDWQHEGEKEGFNPALIELFSDRVKGTPLLLYGGISEFTQLRDFLSHPSVSAVCIGNFLNYREHALQTLKKELTGFDVRAPEYLRELI